MKIVWFDHRATRADGTHLSEKPVLEGFARMVFLSGAERITKKDDIPEDAVAFIHSGGGISDSYWIETTPRPKVMIFLSSARYGEQNDLPGVHFARRGCYELAQGLTQSMMDSFLSSCEGVIDDQKQLFEKLYPKFSTEPLEQMYFLLLQRSYEMKPEEKLYEKAKQSAEDEISKIFTVYPHLKQVSQGKSVADNAVELRRLLACLSAPTDCDEEIQLRRLKHTWLENQILSKTPSIVMSLPAWPDLEDNFLDQGSELSELVDKILKREPDIDSSDTRLSTTLQSFLEALQQFVELWKNRNSENANQVGKYWENVLNCGTALKESLDGVSTLKLYD